MTALTTSSKAELIDYSGIEFESDGTENIAPPMAVIKLVQPTSSMEGAGKHGAEFYHIDREDYTPELDVVPLSMKWTRAYFQEGNAEKPACASPDAETPYPDQTLWEGKHQPAACVECPFGPTFRERNNGATSPCKASMVLLVQRQDDESWALLRLNSMSIDPFKAWVGRLKRRKIAMFTQRARVTAQEFAEPGKKWAQMAFESSDLPRDRVMELNAVMREQRERFAKDIPQEDEVWGDGKTPFRTEPVDPETGEVGVSGRAPTPSLTSRLTQTAAEMFPKVEQP